MSYEKKYKKALDRARKLNSGEGVAEHPDWTVCEVIFPELKESEDERIRKGLITIYRDIPLYSKVIDDVRAEDIIKWLEKQGDKNCQVKLPTFTFEDVLALECAIKTVKITKGGDELYKILVPLYNKIHNAYLVERQGEKKPADKVEPNFKVGDWVIANGYRYKAKIKTFIENDMVEFEDDTFETKENLVKDYHLWTIQDAKEGDVLYSLDSNRPFIYKVRNDYEQAVAYCGLNIYGKFFVWNTKDCVITLSNYVPATKEQRDTLERAITNAGYRWDKEKLKLERI